MSRAETTDESLKSILTESNLPNAARINLWDAFFSLHALDFAKHLHRQEIPDNVKSKLLALKIQTPHNPADKDEILQDAMNDAVAQLWARIGAASL
jgi:hypothetical protein